MKRYIAAASVLAMSASVSHAESATPMRPIDQTITTAATLADVQACVTRDVAHNGHAVVVPIDGGVEIDELTPTILTKPTDPRFRVRIIGVGDARKVEAFYRHPMTAKITMKRLEKMRKNCGL